MKDHRDLLEKVNVSARIFVVSVFLKLLLAYVIIHIALPTENNFKVANGC